jgi:uncharacterized phage protein gp47/JayE
MPFDRPTLPELRDRIRRDFNARLPGADALLRQSNLRVIADVIAGLSHLHHGFQAWLVDQLFPDTAEGPFLERWGAIWGVYRLPPTAALGSVAVRGVPGAQVPQEAEWQRTDGVRYRVLAGLTLDATGTGTVEVEAVEAGAVGNAEAGTTVSTVAALPGIAATGSLPAGAGGGADVEADEHLRLRLLARIQTPPHGGAASDYIDWTLEVPGVTRVWVAPLELGAGTVVVRFCMDDAAHAPDGIPTPADIAAVQAHLNAVRPVAALVTVKAPVATPVAVSVSGLTPDTPEVRLAVETELGDAFFRHGAPGGTLYVSWLWEAVSLASGERHYRIVAPAADVTMAVGALPTLGVVTYVA